MGTQRAQAQKMIIARTKAALAAEGRTREAKNLRDCRSLSGHITLKSGLGFRLPFSANSRAPPPWRSGLAGGPN
jgi:hypothetical protein